MFLEYSLNYLQKNSIVLISTSVTLILTYGFYKLLVKKRRSSKRKTYPKNVVILHQFPRGLRAPSASPFAIKLETWLRMANINYQNEFSYEMSPKGKIPWITYNNIDVADSDFCIKFLIKEFNSNLSDWLTPFDQSLARAYLKINEESLRWAMMVHRFRYGKAIDSGITLPSIAFKIISRRILKQPNIQGYGMHSKEDVYEIGKADIKAIETFIGSKKFLLGDKPCNEDASIFGMICQLINHDRGPFNDFVMNECPNIQRYYENIKTIYWKDWNDVVKEKANN